MKRKGKPRGNPDKINPFKWKKGQSGNPKGRPRKEPLTEILEQVLSETVPKEQDPLEHTLGYVMVRNFVLETIRTKDTHAFNSIIDRVDVKVKERFELGGEDGEPIRIETVDAKRFTDEELVEYEKLVRKATTPRSDD